MARMTPAEATSVNILIGYLAGRTNPYPTRSHDRCTPWPAAPTTGSSPAGTRTPSPSSGRTRSRTAPSGNGSAIQAASAELARGHHVDLAAAVLAPGGYDQRPDPQHALGIRGSSLHR